MLQNILRSMHTNLGKSIISIILGIGLATLFRKACQSRNCLVFEAPPLDEVSNNIYKHDGHCYRFTEKSVVCDKARKTVDFA